MGRVWIDKLKSSYVQTGPRRTGAGMCAICTVRTVSPYYYTNTARPATLSACDSRAVMRRRQEDVRGRHARRAPRRDSKLT